MLQPPDMAKLRVVQVVVSPGTHALPQIMLEGSPPA